MQILRDSSATVVSWRLVNIVSGAFISLPNDWEGAITTQDNLFSLYRLRATVAASGLQLGQHYHIEVEASDGNIYYSEAIFPISGWPGPDNCGGNYAAIKMSWYSPCPIKYAGYHDVTEYEMFVLSDPGRPTWKYSEEGDQAPDGEFIPNFQRIEKEYEMAIYGPEHIGDALAHMALYRVKNIEFQDGEVWEISSCRVEPDWQNDCLAIFRFKFTAKSLSRLGCPADCP